MLDYLTTNLGSECVQISNLDAIRPNSMCLNYTNEVIEDSLSIFNSNFLFDKRPVGSMSPPKSNNDDGVKLFVAPTDRYHINFDLLSSIFYCLSRYEEYGDFEADKHGRFSGARSHAYLNGYLKEPVVDQWVNLLREEIQNRNSITISPKPEFHISPTIDIDSAWAYKHRSLLHTTGSVIKNTFSFKWDRIAEQQKARSKDSDPYDRYSYLKSTLSNFEVIYFFLLHFERPHDTAHYTNKSAFSHLVKQVNTHSSVGMHPSYASNNNIEQLKLEQANLFRLIDKPVTSSRQHFLKLSLPDTYQNLLDIGIEDDYSMGYGDQIGFRAGTSNPFKWYNLAKEQMTSLTIHPFCIMDVTLKDYLKFSATDAIQEIDTLKQAIKREGGTFSFIWHNSSFAAIDGWAGWDLVFESLLS